MKKESRRSLWILFIVLLILGIILKLGITFDKGVKDDNPRFVFAQLTDLHICKVNKYVSPINSKDDDSTHSVRCQTDNDGSILLEAGINGRGNVRQVIGKINNHYPLVNYTFITGDITQYGSRLARAQDLFTNSTEQKSITQLQIAKTELDNLSMKYFPVVGNHDVLNADYYYARDISRGFREVFNLTSTYYSFPIDNQFQFVIMDCMRDKLIIPKNVIFNCSQDELDGLENSLKNGKKTFVFMHVPLFRTDSKSIPNANANKILAIFSKYPNFVMSIGGHAGGNSGKLEVDTLTGVKQFIGSHKNIYDHNGDDKNLNSPIPTIAYFSVYEDRVIINQECTSFWCFNPSQIVIYLNSSF